MIDIPYQCSLIQISVLIDSLDGLGTLTQLIMLQCLLWLIKLFQV